MKIIRISATWCTSCIVTYKDFLSLKKMHPEYEYIEYDYDMDEEEILKYQVGDIIPVLIALDDDNNEIDRLIGEKKETDIFAWIEKVRSK